MDEFKKPVGILTAANTAGLLFASFYFNKQLNNHKVKIEEIEENLSSVITKLKESQSHANFLNEYGKALAKLDKVLAECKEKVDGHEGDFDSLDGKLESIIDCLQENGLEVQTKRSKKKKSKKTPKRRPKKISDDEESDDEDDEDDEDDIMRQVNAVKNARGRRR